MSIRSLKVVELCIALCSGLLIPIDTIAQNVTGRLRFTPPIGETISAFINVTPEGEQSPAAVIDIGAYDPYQFSGTVDESAAKVTLEFVVEKPNGYVARVQKYTKKKNVSFNQVIQVKRKIDVYIELRNRAIKQTNYVDGQRDFNFLLKDLAESPDEKLETYRTYARWIDTLPEKNEAKKAEEQIRILQAAFKSGAVEKVNEHKKFTYWRERLDAFLNLANYTSLQMPAEEFGAKVTQNPVYHAHWSNFVTDYKTVNPDWAPPIASEKGNAVVTTQLQSLREELKHIK